MNRNIVLFLSVFALSTLIFACNKNNSNTTNSENSSEAESVTEEVVPKWLPTDKRVIVLFGYGYNDSSFIQKTQEVLGEEFGLEEESGLIKTLIYPDNFKVGDAERISMLPDLLEGVNVAGLIILGAPERAHVSLARFQDDGRTWPVFSLFPQDDILGTEAGSDFVLDYTATKMTETELMEESVVELSEDLPSLLVSVIRAMQSIEKVPVPVADLLPLVQQIAGSTWKISHYVDVETGLTSANHFVLEK